MIDMKKFGFTLIETVIYIAIIAIILPALALFIVNIVSRQEQLAQRIQISQTTALLFDEFRYELQEARYVSITGSTFGVNPSSLRFTDRNGIVITIAVVNSTYTADGVSHTVKRLQLTQGAATSWMTGNEVTVDTFSVNYVRNGAGDLSAINIDLIVKPLVTTTTAQSAQTLTLSTSIWLNSYVQEN